jgi:2-oxoglutarate dehydrogenase E1 component
VNSPLSEAAAFGFEYGYSCAASSALVLCEAQYGDFVNNAQAFIDQFLVSGEAKWGQRCGLVLLLPHGYEGRGPDHSSAALERFLFLAAENNIRVVYPTTAAQYFHLLREHALMAKERQVPLIVMTAKGLLRHPLSLSSLADLEGGSFQQVLSHSPPREPAARVRRCILCSGRVFTDLAAALEKRPHEEGVGVVRLEQLLSLPGRGACLSCSGPGLGGDCLASRGTPKPRRLALRVPRAAPDN